jgi:hypothetical protein
MARKKKGWFKPKRYLHITKQLDPVKDKKSIIKLVTNRQKVAQHAFFPLLHKKLTQRRYKVIDFDKSGNPIRGHNKAGKSTKKVRPIHYATHIDAAIYAYYANEIINPKYENELKAYEALSDCVTAYRQISADIPGSNKNNIHFAKEVFDFIKDQGDCCAMAFDIESFFTNLDHKVLKKAWCKLLGTRSLPKDHYNVFKSITNYSYIDLNELRQRDGGFNERRLAEIRRKYGVKAFFSTPEELRAAIKNGEIRVFKSQYKHPKSGHRRGIPQGLPISAILANLYLLEFDKLVYDKVMEHSGGLYRRYSDDIVVICKIEQREEIERFVMEAIKKFNLEVAKSKTDICMFKRKLDEGTQLDCYKLNRSKNGKDTWRKSIPFQYLGFSFDGKKVLLKGANLSKFYRRMRQSIRRKAKRLEKAIQSGKPVNAIVYKRKLRRLYTHHGQSGRRMTVKASKLVYRDLYDDYMPENIASVKKYRGNYYSYVIRSARIMKEPAIRNQLRKHEAFFNREMLKLATILDD